MERLISVKWVTNVNAKAGFRLSHYLQKQNYYIFFLPLSQNITLKGSAFQNVTGTGVNIGKQHFLLIS